jgi:hypothetical protein
MAKITFQPVFIIGAARSGTKLLRDQIARHPDIACVPYDINYIWRFGNEKLPHDELSTENFTQQICLRIQSRFESFANGKPLLVEKTVSNCLRVPYIQKIFPEAYFIHLVRHPLDVIESTYRQWTAKPDLKYIFKKARTFPFTESLGYGLFYAWTTLNKLILSDPSRAGTWGPRYTGIDQDVLTRDLWEVCTTQWIRCVSSAKRDLDNLSSEHILTVQYEEFVETPIAHLKRIANFLDIESSNYDDLDYCEISSSNIGKRTKIPHEKLQAIISLLETSESRTAYAVKF